MEWRVRSVKCGMWRKVWSESVEWKCVECVECGV